MNNEFAVLALTGLLFVSRKRNLILIIISFYLMYMALEAMSGVTYIGYQEWWLPNIIIDLLVCALCYHMVKIRMAYSNVAIVYMGWVICFFVLPECIFISNVAQSNAYRALMEIAIPVDLACAIIGSDNKVSRWLCWRFGNSYQALL